jgi:stage V sporulation protein AE
VELIFVSAEWRINMEKYVIAFIVGGFICAAVQVLMEKTKLMPGRIMVLLVCAGAVLGAVGLYQPFADWAGAGATVPLGLAMYCGRE